MAYSVQVSGPSSTIIVVNITPPPSSAPATPLPAMPPPAYVNPNQMPSESLRGHVTVMTNSLNEVQKELDRAERSSPVEKAQALIVKMLQQLDAINPILREFTIPANPEVRLDPIPEQLLPRECAFMFLGKMPRCITSLQVASVLKESFKDDLKVFDVTIIHRRDPISGVMVSNGCAYVLVPIDTANCLQSLHQKLTVLSDDNQTLQIKEYKGVTGDFVCELANIPVTELNLRAHRTNPMAHRTNPMAHQAN